MENLRENDRVLHVQHTIDYIEECIHKPLLIGDISGYIYLSKYHLQRIFKSLTGRGVMEYARSRKLTESLYDLLHTDARIVNIAGKYGFEYEQSFTRAFKGEFGLSPSEYRRSPRHVQITPKADPSLLIELDHALIVKPFHVFRPAFELGGLLRQVGIRENLEEFKATSLAVDFFHRHRSRIIRPIEPDVYYGYTYWGEEKGQYTYYLSGVEIGQDSELPADMSRIVVPTGSYTVFRFIGFFPPEELNWKHLLDFWNFKDDFLLKDKPVDWENHFHFEYVDWSLCREDYCELDYYVPVI